MEYIIVQAGGMGTRLGHLTDNKPKALVPVDNLPILFHLFKKFRDKRFVIISDYKKNVMREYLAAFADVKYQIVETGGMGNCAGINDALELLPENEPFLLIWSDLILPDGFSVPEEYQNGTIPKRDYIGLSMDFPCRWKYEKGHFSEESSISNGVAGFFLFTDKAKLRTVPRVGEFVQWLKDNKTDFQTLDLSGTKEFGLIEEYNKLEAAKCRPFNRISVKGDILTKEPVDSQGEKLAILEGAWYEKAQKLNISILPHIYSTNPLRMEYIKGQTIYDGKFSKSEKEAILYTLINALKKIHSAETVPADSFSVYEAYYCKTMRRISSIRDLVPFADRRKITINGKKCRNIFFYKNELKKKLSQLKCNEFNFIHGDCTFSNIILRGTGEPVLIDPRGYFGFTSLYGDARYDWAKLYYSIVGNYDSFNLNQFRLEIGGKNGSRGTTLSSGEVNLYINSNGWEDMEDHFFAMTGMVPYEIKLLHAIIWLSFTTYAWQNYDSLCGAFYNGLYYLEDVL